MIQDDTKAVGKKLKKELICAILESLQRQKIDFSNDPENTIPPKKKGEYDVEEHLNIPYMNHEEIPLAMDVFRPLTDKKDKLPMIVVIHGGGLVIGDRRLSRNYGSALARKGYLVISLEYRLFPHANVLQEHDDVCAGLEAITPYLTKMNVDEDRIYLTCESAGAYLALYVCTLLHNPKGEEVSGYSLPKIRFAGIGLICGMLYTNLHDPIGEMFGEQYKTLSEVVPNIREHANPEHPDIINYLPPVFLTTSNGDFLNNYTLKYHKALKAAGKPVKLKYYGNSKLEHAFVTMRPYIPESQDAIETMLKWFESFVPSKADKKEKTSKEHKTAKQHSTNKKNKK